jgi:ankyrin repeat protein
MLLEVGAKPNKGRMEGGKTDLVMASVDQNVELVRLLLRKGAKVNYGSRKRWPALANTAKNGRCDIVRLLIQWGADIDAELANGQRALHLATKKNHPDVVKALVAAGANRFKVDRDGRTPLWYAGEEATIGALYSCPTAARLRWTLDNVRMINFALSFVVGNCSCGLT